MISFTCDQCGGEVDAPEERAGSDYECPGCGKVLVVPERGAASPGRSADPAAPQPRSLKLAGIAGSVLAAALIVWWIVSAGPQRDAREHYNRGNEYYEKGDLDHAIADYTKAIELKPDYAESYCRRGWTHYRDINWDRAITDFGRAIELKSDWAPPYGGRGRAHYQKQDWDRAIVDQNRAVELAPHWASVRANRGWTYVAKGEYDRALADFTKAIGAEAGCAWAHRGRATTYMMMGDSKRAQAGYDKAVEIDPENGGALMSRGLFHAVTREWDLAEADLRRATELRPEDPLRGAYHLAWVLVGQGKEREAAALASSCLARQGYKNRRWPWRRSIGKCLAGELTEDELLALAAREDTRETGLTTQQKLCEAYLFVGMVRIGSGDAAGGEELLRKCVATGVSHFITYEVAKAWLVRKARRRPDDLGIQSR